MKQFTILIAILSFMFTLPSYGQTTSIGGGYFQPLKYKEKDPLWMSGDAIGVDVGMAVTKADGYQTNKMLNLSLVLYTVDTDFSFTNKTVPENVYGKGYMTKEEQQSFVYIGPRIGRFPILKDVLYMSLTPMVGYFNSDYMSSDLYYGDIVYENKGSGFSFGAKAIIHIGALTINLKRTTHMFAVSGGVAIPLVSFKN